MTSLQPTLLLHPLHTADGSCHYTSPRQTHTLITGINYPIEVPYRSDELPQSTHIEVSLRPHNGVAMVKERHVETLIKKTLEAVVLGEETPRTGLQVTVQVMEVQVDESLPGGVKEGGQGDEWLDLLVGGINSALVACLDGGVRMRGLVGAVLVGLTEVGHIIICPDIVTRKTCRSLHAFAFDSRRRCVLMESEGSFDMEEWETAETSARRVVCGDELIAANGDVDMDTGDGPTTCLFSTMRKVVEASFT